MNYILVLIFVFFSFLSFSQERKLSLKECIQLATENNENLKNSKLEERISKALSREYLSIGLPQINLDGGLKYNHDVPKSLIDISRFMPGVPEGTEQEVQFGQAYDGRVDLFINQMIFNGSYFVGLSAAKELVRLSEKSLAFTKSVIPNFLPQLSFSLFKSTPTICEAPISFSPCITFNPIPPKPKTTARQPASALAVLITAPIPVVIPQPI